MNKIPDPKKFVEKQIRTATKKVFLAEAKSSFLFLVTFFLLLAGILFWVGFENFLVVLYIFLAGAVIILIGFLLKLILNKKFREDFLSFLAMDDWD